MEFRTQLSAPGALASLDADALVLIVPDETLDPALDPRLATLVTDALASGDFQVKPGKTLYLHHPADVKARRVVLAAAPGCTPKTVRSALAAALGHLKTLGATDLVVAFPGSGAWSAALAELAVTTVQDALYAYRHTKPSAPKPSALSRVSLVCEKAQQKSVAAGVHRGEALAAGITLAREWANRPSNHCTPRHLGDVARKLGKDFELKVEVLERKAIEELGMGSFLAVAQGSHEPPRFIVIRYQGAAKSAAPVVLVGKGVTFDTGGISIKPAGDMDEMKFDMGGAASVLGTMRAIAEIKPKLNVVALIPATENMPDGKAIKPGDVVTSLSGQTIEILNTDAEGRLILCDALTYAERFKPAAVIDIATLTGACVIALGHQHSGLFTADDALAQQLLAAGQASLDTVWRMPLDEEYDDALKSNFADMGNVGGRAGGSITAARFLAKFTGAYRWAHLDIAGTAWKSGAAKGATGRPVSLLTHFLLAYAA